MTAGFIVWPGTNFNGRTCSVTNGSAIATATGNLAEDLGSAEPGAAGWGFLGPDDRLYCVTSTFDYDPDLDHTTFAIHRGYVGSTVASGGRFDVVPFQGLSSSAAFQLAQLLQYYTPTIRAVPFANEASLPPASKNGQIAYSVADGALFFSDGTAWHEVAGGTGGGGGTSYYDLPINLEGKPGAGETFPIIPIVRASRLPAGLTLSRFAIQTPPASAMVFTLYKNAGSIGTVSYATSGIATVTFAADVDFAAGDQFSMIAPTPQDAAGTFVSMNIVFTVL